MFCPMEQPGDRVGWGHLPLLEAIGSGEVTYPNSNDLKEQMVAFLRASSPMNNVSCARILNLYNRPDTFTSALKANSSSIEWSEYRGPVGTTTAMALPTGLSYFHYHVEHVANVDKIFHDGLGYQKT